MNPVASDGAWVIKALVTTAIVWSIVDREGAGWLGIGLAVLGRPFLRGVAAWLQHGALTDETLSS